MINIETNVVNVIVYVSCMANFWSPIGPITYLVDFYTANTLFSYGLHLRVAALSWMVIDNNSSPAAAAQVINYTLSSA